MPARFDVPNVAQSLNGRWALALDPQNRGRQDGWFHHPIPGGVEVRDAEVPGTIQHAFPGQHGVAWYWRSFVPARISDSEECSLLRFHAVDYLADVWLNGEHLGSHEGGETPFTLDATTALTPHENLLVVRVLNPTRTAIDGVVLGQTPHSNKMMEDDFNPGNGKNYGGIVQPVEYLVAPAIRITDIFVRPDPNSGQIALTVTIANHADALAEAHVRLAAGPAQDGVVLAATTLSGQAPPGVSRHEALLRVPQHRLWELDDPYLYRVDAVMEAISSAGTVYQHSFAVRCGFRDFRVVDGFFRLNGKRLFIRSTHGHTTRGDAILAKATGFNMVRYIAGMGRPAELDFCDEIGLLVYEESRAAWMLGDSPELGERFDRSVREMILRDQRHPSVVVWGLLNETPDNPTFRHATGMLPLIRELDPTRTILLGSGRWDRDRSVGSVCNPGRTDWEPVWGNEENGTSASAAVTGFPWDRGQAGYADGAGDAHVYPHVPQSAETNIFIRTLARDSKPVFLSEYGIGSLLDVVHIMGCFEQAREEPEPDDVEVYRTMRDLLDADWKRFGMEVVYPFPQDLLRESQRLHSRQRLMGLNLIRSNPRINGHNITGMLDHGYTGEGLWTLGREFKPGVVEALEDGWAPLRWCLFVSPQHTYSGRTVTIEVALANEDVLCPGDYPTRLCIFGPDGRVWDHAVTAHLPRPPAGEDAPLAVPVFKGEVQIEGPAGAYVLAARMERGGSPAGGRTTFFLAEAALPRTGADVMAWGLEERATAWLTRQGVHCRSFEPDEAAACQVILVGDLSAVATSESDWQALATQMARGSTVLFLAPQAFRRGEDAVGWLPLVNKGRCYEFSNWVYHREDVARPHPIFAGLPGRGILDWDYYGPVIPHTVFEGQDTPDDIAAVFFAVGYASLTQRVTTGYAAGLITAFYTFGAGRFLINSLQILENLDRHPAADRLLLNIIEHAIVVTPVAPGAPASQDIAALLNAIGYSA